MLLNEDVEMRTNYDFTPFFRSSIGFDRIFDLLEHAEAAGSSETWPPYDIARAGEDSYRISMAVAGYAPDELKVTCQPNLLVVSGAKPEMDEATYLYRGIGGGKFERRFELADFVEVAGARLENGILTIDLKRELPEQMKPRKIAIATGAPATPAAKPTQIGHQQAA
jgi:molecular chaperone IbpA